MNTAKQIQTYIFDTFGLKTSVKRGTGSMKGYIIIWPQYQGGGYPNLPVEALEHLRNSLSHFEYENYPLFCTTSEVCVYGLEDERVKYKKESKAKERGGAAQVTGAEKPKRARGLYVKT